MSASPPVPDKRPHSLGAHGRTRTDEYYWLRDDNWQAVMQDPSRLRADVRAHLEAENTHTKTILAPTEALQETLYQEMRGRIKEQDDGVPMADGPYAYFARYETGGQYPVLCRGPRDDPQGAQVETLLHADTLAKGHAYFNLGDSLHSPDHQCLAYATDTQGSEYYTIFVRDLTTQADLTDRIENTAGTVLWTPDSTGLIYIRLDDNHRPSTVWLHRLGTDPSKDTLLYRENDPAFYVSVSLTESRRFLLINAHDHQTSEIHLVEANTPQADLRLVAARREGHEYSLSDRGAWFYILTNSGGAEDFRIMRAPIKTPDDSHWEEIVPHEAGRLILGLDLYQDHLVRLERQAGLPRIVITAFNEDGALGESHEIALAEEAYALSLAGGYEFATSMLRYTYASPTTPTQVFDYDMATRDRVLRKTQEVPSGHDPADYVTRRLHVTAPDGTQVPVTVLHRADVTADGTAPLLLYGYGSYGISMPSGFSIAALSLADRGLVTATAHIRGGMEMGYRWYTDGKLFRKKNTFTDFIAAAEGLIAAGYTAPGRIVAQGGSAGGLLMGAVSNLRPDLFRGIIAEVPFVDVLTTISDADLPLTPPEWTEWGNPITDEEAYDYIESYSPYDQVTAQAYPHILATGGLSDPRVTYWEPAKWVARLRDRRTDDGLTLLWTYMEAGHGGAAGRFEHLRETAQVFAFALMTLDQP